jgi:MoaA/NifB/PqqE/SkfB family radical SAM enzyme
LRDKIDEILRCGLHSIEISLNGHDAVEFNRMTGQPKECYSLVCDNVRALLVRRNEVNSALRVSLSFILDQQNYRDVFGMIDRAESLGVDGVSFPNFLPSPVPGFTAEERCLYADNQDILRVLSQARSSHHRIEISLPALVDRSRKERYCRSYFRLLRVDGEGDVGGCAGQLLNLAGNGKFYDEGVWNNDHFRARRSIFLDRNVPELPPCQTCPRNNRPEIGGT